ncbi:MULTISPECIES: hypothetical protein [Vibrio]|uniref:Uncharacterized protein n=1 Tax=Vibrio lentus TaxID=136468 RepID=A0A2N7BLF9_9VIBR|nr:MULTISPECIES: hypothetical protein [Vibrio]KZX67037.1 hypothetical protein A3712_16240 [Vibrio sp. HI00D65]MBJ2147562.1 hypothetical protein [Vibrio sp. IB15]PME50889.1 hypothetical protein BCV34_01250 [Vibrio lentus]PME58925.1 hypothetical protein BCV30_15545 [Vibrio lentus]PME80868.1 hypothetical protein BCV27_15115 [Vibrio lentus]|tara:strand:- start:151 stop:369 length:219 start_codon:yes stop_codon:yes gene_type:complete
MPYKKMLFQRSLDVIIDGISMSEARADSAQVGVYLMGLLIADNKGELDADKIKAIQSIIRMAAEAETPKFSL